MDPTVGLARCCFCGEASYALIHKTKCPWCGRAQLKAVKDDDDTSTPEDS